MGSLWGSTARSGVTSLTEGFQCKNPLTGLGARSLPGEQMAHRHRAQGTCTGGVENKAWIRLEHRIHRNGWNSEVLEMSPLTSVLRVWLSLTVTKLLYEIEQNHMNRPTEHLAYFAHQFQLLRLLEKSVRRTVMENASLRKKKEKKTTVRPYWIAVLVFISKELLCVSQIAMNFPWVCF